MLGGDDVKDFREIQIKSILILSFVHCWSHSVTEYHWAGLTGLALGEAVLAVLNHFLEAEKSTNENCLFKTNIFPCFRQGVASRVVNAV